jgi:hypothetical protein
MRSGQRLNKKVRFILAQVDAGRVSARKTGLPASYLSRIKSGSVKKVSEKAEQKFSRAYDKYWQKELKTHGVTTSQARDIVQSDFSVKAMDKIVSNNLKIAEKLVRNRIRRDKDLPKYKDSWHTVDKVLKQMSSRKMDSWTTTEWLSYTRKIITPALNRGKFFESPEHKQKKRIELRKGKKRR